MEKKSIAFVIGSLSSGGAERVVSTLSNQFIERYNIYIITFIDRPPFYKLDKRIKVLSCFEEISPSKNLFQALRTNFYLYRRIAGFLKAEKIDLCIGFLTSPNVLSVLASKANGIPVIISERNDPSSSKQPFIWELLRKFTYPKANYIIVQTETIKQFFLSWIDESKLKILPNPLSPDLHYTPIPDNARENVVLNVGRLTDQKGQDLLIKAFSEINPEGWKLIIVGEGRQRRTLEDLIQKLEMIEKILLPGREKNIDKYYSLAKIFAFPSRFEGFPNALIEAMYMGLPCISTDCPTGPSELISNGINGFMVEVDDQRAFMEKLKLLIEKKDLRSKFSEGGKKVVNRFSVSKVTRAWDEVIQSAL